MVTPHDIATKEFKKVAVGYSPEEVDIFLDEIYEDDERMYQAEIYARQNPEPIQQPQEEEITFKNMEKTLERTLALAEAAALETKEAAKAEAAQIVAKAKLERDEMMADVRNQLYEAQQEIASLQNRYELMRARVKLLLYAEIELLDKGEVLSEKEAAIEP